ncbi:hypothetical protein EAF04_004817 [Stromatinia cepivora]|nr:hypothetical protein EAF04_004817 [Stromatinia cepivora]
MTSLLYTYVGEGVRGGSNDGNGELSSTLYCLVSLQLFSSFKALSLAGFLLKYEWGIWVICALAIGFRVIAVGMTMFLPSVKVINSPTDVGLDGENTGAERDRYRDVMSDSEDNSSEASTTSKYADTSSSLSINKSPMPSPRLKPRNELQILLLSLLFLVTFSLRIHILYPQFTNLSQNLSYDITTTVYSFCLLGAGILLYILPRIQGYIELKRKLRVLFIGAEENEDPSCGSQAEEMKALPTTKGVVFWMAIGASVAGSPVQVALMAWGSGLVSGLGSSTSLNGFSDEDCGKEGGFISTRSVLGDVDVGVDSEVGGINGKGKGKWKGISEMEKLYVRMGMIEQVGACLATGVWSLGCSMGMGGNDNGNEGANDGLVDLGNWDFRGWMGERGGFLLAAGLMGLGFVIVWRLERRDSGGAGRIVLP